MIEIQNSKQESFPGDSVSVIGALYFEFVSDFGFRILNFLPGVQ